MRKTKCSKKAIPNLSVVVENYRLNLSFPNNLKNNTHAHKLFLVLGDVHWDQPSDLGLHLFPRYLEAYLDRCQAFTIQLKLHHRCLTGPKYPTDMAC